MRASECARRLVLFVPASPSRVLALYEVDETLPATRLDPRLVEPPGRRAALGLRQLRCRRLVDLEIDTALVQGRDLVGRHEPLPTVAVQNDSVEDVLLGSGDHVGHGANLLAPGCVHRHPRLQHLVSDRQPLIHESAQ